MKKISEHIGEIIVALVGVALLVAACVVFRAPIGDFFQNIVDKQTSVGNSIITDIQVPDLSPGGPDNNNNPSIIPAGATYTTAGGTVLTEGEAFPAKAIGDRYEDNDYIYIYKIVADTEHIGDFVPLDEDGWSVISKEAYRILSGLSPSQTTVGAILESINGSPITNMVGTFHGCTSLTTAPTIPSSVTNMQATFGGCTSLTTAPTIPSSVTNMQATFVGCTSLAAAPTIPNSVTDMSFTFQFCTSLTTAPDMRNASSVTDMSHTFEGCTSLTTAPTILSSVTDMSFTFQCCTSLTTAPVIPSSVTNMHCTFSECTSLTTAPVIPSSVTNMASTFSECTSLTTAPVIPSSVTDMSGTFYGCTSLTAAPVIPSSVTDMSGTFWDCTSLTGTIVVNAANLNDYMHCFSGTTKAIQLTGTCPELSAIASVWNNVTVAP